MELKRKQEESDFAYKERLIVAKLDKEIDLDWSEIAELLGEDCHPDHLRKTAYGIYESYKYRLENAIDITGQDILDTIEAKKIELQKERYKLSDQRVAFNKMVRQKARQEEINEIIEKCISEGNLPVLNVPVKQPAKRSNKSMLVSLNDLHYLFNNIFFVCYTNFVMNISTYHITISPNYTFISILFCLYLYNSIKIFCNSSFTYI